MIDLSTMSDEAVLELHARLVAERDSLKYWHIRTLFPDEGPLGWREYKKHFAFWELGATVNERALIAANRTGKTVAGAFETVSHLIGEYRPWWPGVRFTRWIEAWVAGDTVDTVRDILQPIFLGSHRDLGSGLIPKELIVDVIMRRGGSNVVDTVIVRRVDGNGESVLQFKSYEMGREAFQGTKKQIVLLDEEPKLPIYAECLMRTMATGDGQPPGHIMLTFTPLLGMSETVLSFLPGGKIDEHAEVQRVINLGWDDAPHLSTEEKERLRKSIPPYQIKARTLGIPMLGSGAIYPIDEADITVPSFAVPDYWPRGYGFDVGWTATAAVWMARDLSTDTIYVYDVYKRGQAEPATHIAAVNERGDWIPGFIDPSAAGAGKIKDGEAVLAEYQRHLNVEPADNTVEAGIYDVYKRMTEGRFKVMSHCTAWFEESRLYRRDDKGKIVKVDDHLMDATRYGVREVNSWSTQPGSSVTRYNGSL